MATKVLIAEDEKNIVESLSFILKREGYEVSAIFDGAEVIDAVTASPPDIVILDVMLPQTNGFEILKQLRGTPQIAGLPVIVITAKGQAQDRATAANLGADVFMSKPFSNKDIVAEVKRLTASA
ncbi:response regulator transcription factor [Denitrobaculum tricleocarpae]|uniref:Response regulator transcription factor n=1 Tax=Denitrobaculum tricleocarpae TaxID=2591009 RepID=A0A545TEN6_9PROT|nr:response regulator [Denitrobaculum tricleocarpae]TQV75688.1 response regulator transcription factor [Denitrobaculum tricleocarpae]